MNEIYRTKAGDMLGEICWLYYGRSRGAVERALEANSGLADREAVLPAGVEIVLRSTKRWPSSRVAPRAPSLSA